MILSQLPAAAALLATIGLWIILLTRHPGINDQFTTFLHSMLAYGVGSLFTLVASLVLVHKGAFDWIASGSVLRYSVVITLHLIGGAVGLLGIFGVLSFDAEWWVVPCAVFATLLPLLVHGATFNASCRPALIVVIALQAAAILLVPAGYFARVVMKERAVATREATQEPGAFERAEAIPSNARIEQYFPFVVDTRDQGLAEYVARKFARRDDHEALLAAALRGPDRYKAMCFLAVAGIPPTPGLAAAVRDAISVAARTTPVEDRDRECKIAKKVAKRFEAFAPIPTLPFC